MQARALGNPELAAHLLGPAAGGTRRRETAGTLHRALGNQRVQRLVQTQLRLGSPGDAYEQEAERIAAAVTVPSGLDHHGGRFAPAPAAGGRDTVYGTPATSRPAQGAGIAHRTAPSAVERALESAGAPLDMGVRQQMEAAFGADFTSVRVHTDAEAATAATAVGAQAFAVGQDVVFATGEYAPGSLSGRRLIAHELAHVIQQTGGADGAVIQRQGAADPVAEAAAESSDFAARMAGPCGVVESALSNRGLLYQLNRARLYLSQHTWGEDETYDYANLLRRLSAERYSRVRGGQAWLAEPGLLNPPEELYAIETSGLLSMAVRRVSGAAAGGAYTPSNGTVVTPSQFERFLQNRRIPTVDMTRYMDSLRRGGPGATNINLPTEVRERTLPIWNYAADPFGPGGIFSAPSLDFGRRQQEQQAAFERDPFRLSDPLRLGLGSQPSRTDPGWPFVQTIKYMPTAGELLGESRSAPGLITREGPERIFMPAPSAAPALAGSPFDSPFLMPQEQSGGPTGISALGYLGRPGIGLPHGTTGIMWEGSHVVDVVVMNDRLFARGFRAPLWTHMADTAERTFIRGGGPATRRLNVGTPGSYANDALFPYAGELWGRSGSHWRGGSVAIVRIDGTPVQAAEVMQLMAEATGTMKGQTYRYSTPPENNPAFQRAAAQAERQGIINWCQLGGTNCINVPADIHSRAMGGLELTVPGPDGGQISLVDPAHASAQNMSAFMSQPDAFFEERGLMRVRIGGRAWGGAGAAGGLGAGMSLLSDAYRASQGEDVSWVANTAISGGSNVVSVVAEDWLATGMTSRLMSSGVSAGRASTLGRAGASTGVAVVVAPLVTGAQMYFDDRRYTDIDYVARMTRSGVAGVGGALATAGYFALVGSSLGPAGTAVGFLVGIVGFAVTDWLFGDPVEEAIREAMGEKGCEGGVGAGH